MDNLQDLQEKKKKRKTLEIRRRVQPTPESKEFIELQLGTLEQEIETLEREIEENRIKFTRFNKPKILT